MREKGRGVESCFVCDRAGDFIVKNEGIIYGVSVVFETMKYESMLSCTNICLDCAGRLHQLFDFNLFYNVFAQEYEGRPRITDNGIAMCSFCQETDVIRSNLSNSINAAIAKTKWAEHHGPSDTLCCFSCYNFLLCYARTAELFEQENARFLERIKCWQIRIPRCSHPDGTLMSVSDVSNESDSDTTAKNSEGQSEVEEIPRKKRRIQAAPHARKSVMNRLNIRANIQQDTTDKLDKFTLIKMRHSCEPSKSPTLDRRQRIMPLPVEIKAEPAVKEIKAEPAVKETVRLDTTETVAQVPLTEADPETVEPTTREQEEHVPETQQTALQEEIFESTVGEVEPRESEAPQMAPATKDSTIELQEVTRTTTQDDATEPEPEATQTTTHNDATEPEAEVETQASAAESEPEDEMLEPAPEAAAGELDQSAEDVPHELRQSLSFIADQQLPVISSLSQIDLFNGSDVAMDLGDGSDGLNTTTVFDASDVDMNLFPGLNDVANEEEIESSPIKSDAEYISDYNLKAVSVMLQRCDPDKLRKILGPRMPDSHKVTKSGRIWKPKIIVDPSTEVTTRKNLKKRSDSKLLQAKGSKVLKAAKDKQKRGRRPGIEKKSSEHRSKDKKERPSKNMKEHRINDKKGHPSMMKEHRSKDMKESPSRVIKERPSKVMKEQKSDEMPRKEKKDRLHQSPLDEFFESPEEEFPMDLEETFVDFALEENSSVANDTSSDSSVEIIGEEAAPTQGGQVEIEFLGPIHKHKGRRAEHDPLRLEVEAEDDDYDDDDDDDDEDTSVDELMKNVTS